MKVLQVLLDNRIGGIATRLLAVAATLKAHGVETIVAVPDEPGGFDQLCLSKAIQARRLTIGRPSPRSMRRNWHWAMTFGQSVGQLRNLIRAEQISVVQVNGFACFQGAIAARQEKIPVAWLLANMMYPRWLVRPLMPLMRRSCHMVSESALIHEYFCGSKVPLSNESIIHETVDVDEADKVLADPRVRSEVRHALGIPMDAKLLICVANLTPVKGHRDLLLAFARVRAEITDAHLMLVGAEFETQRSHVASLRALAGELHLEEAVTWAGQRRDVLRLVHASDLFVMASHNEGTPLAILEAMSLGKPVVVPAVGGIPDQVVDGQSGRLVPPRDPEALADGLVALLKDPVVADRLGRGARERVEKCFGLSAHAAEFAALYRQLASDQPR